MLRYIRLERRNVNELADLYPAESLSTRFVEAGLSIVKKPLSKILSASSLKICILSSGYMLGRVCKAWDKLTKKGHQISVVDLWKIKPLNLSLFKQVAEEYDIFVTVEEQTLSAGFGSAVLEGLADLGLKKHVLRLGLPERYIYENGSRDYLVDKNGLSTKNIEKKIIKFVSEIK